ncbi:hypothetical protein [Streptacidiphilus cavernicola]|uniref:Uncharacterized protein n=1 Tax=Streptacidiphilus cavernicola TaxID=3342716 RepID=A0ABV6VNG7_9ACTN
MSAMIDSPVRHVNRHRAHSLRPTPGRDTAPTATADRAAESATDPLWTATESVTETWDDRIWDDKGWDVDTLEASGAESAGTAASAAHAPSPATLSPAPVPAPAPAPAPAFDTRPVVAPGPASQPGDGLSVPPRRTVGPFPPIRAGGGRHRLPAAVRRRPGPIAAGLMVAATTLAAGTLRFSAPAPLRTSADAGHQCGPLLPGEPCR